MTTQKSISINPKSESIIGEYAYMSATTINDIAQEAQVAQRAWSTSSMEDRRSVLLVIKALLLDRKEEWAQMITDEMGKVIAESLAEVEKCAWLCSYYAGHGASFLEDEIVNTESKKSFITYRPLGVILAIMPWNFPFWQVFRCAIPAIMAGNAVLLKHASNVSGCSLAIETIFRESGCRENLFRNILIPGRETEIVIEHPIVKAISLTGSGKAGSTVASKAGAKIKKTVLELGGNDAYIILEDGDLDLAVNICLESRLRNCGQKLHSC